MRTAADPASVAGGPASAADGATYGRVVRTCAAFATAGAGILHLDAAGDHVDHLHVAAFFVAVACGQLLWAASAVRPSTTTKVFAAGLVLNAAVLAVWLVSRTVGLPDVVPDVGGVEAIGWKDAAASGLALAALVAGGLALAMPPGAVEARLSPRSGERVLRAMAAATLAVTVPGALASHTHDDHEHSAAGHGHAGEELAAVPVHHDDGDHGDDHAHGDDPAHDDHSGGGGHGSSGGTHVHAEVLEGDPHAPTSGPGHDHAVEAVPAAHAHGGTTPGVGGTDGPGGQHHDHGAARSATPSPPDPLAGPGQITTVRLGPFALLPSVPGAEVPHGPPAMPWVGPGALNAVPLFGVPQPCQDCFVLGLQPDLVYVDGTPANLDTGPMLHHAVWTDTSRTDPVCGRDTLVGKLGHRVFASGNERTGFTAPEGFGVPFGRSTWGGAVELMNTSSEVKVVFVQLTARWVPRSTEGLKSATPVWLDIDSCGDSAVDIPAGTTDITWDWPSTVTGRIITAGGHLHDGGEWLGLVNRTSGEHVCTSVAGYGRDPRFRGTLESMSVCTWDRLAAVRTGDVLRLTAHYNTTEPGKDVMGIMIVLVHETADLDGGRPSPYPAEPPPSTGPPAPGGHVH